MGFGNVDRERTLPVGGRKWSYCLVETAILDHIVRTGLWLAVQPLCHPRDAGNPLPHVTEKVSGGEEAESPAIAMLRYHLGGTKAP